ncbi:MAG: hypothetical protein IPJ86_11265 [Bacteroidetes bacterium]|nr:hypothetical protein [Bacteroidota bacterium]
MTKMIFKKGIYLLLTFTVSFPLFGQTEKVDSLKKELIGSWDFVELRDNYNNKVDTIKNEYGFEIPKGPLLTYRADGTYSKQFTPANTDNGKWYFDIEKNAIIHFLYYEKPYSLAAKYLIDHGHAKQDENGEYYEIITDKVVELTENKLILLEREERQRKFKKLEK